MNSLTRNAPFTGNQTMKPVSKRPLIVLAICAVCTLIFLVLWARGFDPLRQDARFKEILKTIGLDR